MPSRATFINLLVLLALGGASAGAVARVKGPHSITLPDEAAPVECSLPSTYDYSDHPGYSANHDYEYAINNNPAFARYGRKSLRFELRPGDSGTEDRASGVGYERTEINQTWGEVSLPGSSMWYGWSQFVPTTFKDSVPAGDMVGTIMASFQQCCSYHLNFSFIKVAHGPFILYTFPSAGSLPRQRFDLITDRDFRGRWHDFVVHAKWSFGKNGAFDLWVDGQLKARYRGPTLERGQESTFHKLHLYRAISRRNPKRQWVYYDEIRRGTTRGCVDIRRLVGP